MTWFRVVAACVLKQGGEGGLCKHDLSLVCHAPWQPLHREVAVMCLSAVRAGRCPMKGSMLCGPGGGEEGGGPHMGSIPGRTKAHGGQQNMQRTCICMLLSQHECSICSCMLISAYGNIIAWPFVKLFVLHATVPRQAAQAENSIASIMARLPFRCCPWVGLYLRHNSSGQCPATYP